MSFPKKYLTDTVTIAAGASLSGASTLPAGYSLVGLVTAATWDAAKISLAASIDGTNFYPVKDSTAEFEIASVTGAACIAVEVTKTVAWSYLKVRSGISTAATNQVDATIVTLVLMAI